MKYRYATHIFDFSKIQEALPPDFFKAFKKAVDSRKSLPGEVADILAQQIKKWAETMGATHYTHWFLPLTGLTAGKQNTFLERDDEGEVITRFSGKDLVKGEPDASSFPHGGMRSTFEARGYTAWDPSSPVFIIERPRGCLLYIPSVFFAYNGKVLDKKTPLLRSLKLINETSLQLMALFRQRADWVKNMVGAEQEFFLVREKDLLDRPDLKTLGRVLFASRPPKGQQMGDHYFGAIPEMVLAYLEEVEEEAMKLGIPIKTRHNEVAPNQFEVAPIYEEANIGADHNQILMDLLTRVARRHQLVCLLHEKPFPFFNGSGKHLNWSLMDSRGRNLLIPGENRAGRLMFLSFLTGFLVGLHRHNRIIQSVLASPGNELRLGGHEAPPSIISVFLGEELQIILDDPVSFVAGKNGGKKMYRLEESVMPILHDRSDRNRTSPVAFTGNKFEFRMPGSSASLAFPMAVINLAVVDGLYRVMEVLRGKETRDEAGVIASLKGLLDRHKAIIFDGDNYNVQWQLEAKERGLYIPESLPATINCLRDAGSTELFETYNILTKDEVEARAGIKMEIYVKTVEMELRVARHMLRAYVIPAALKYQSVLLAAVDDFPDEVQEQVPGILEPQLKFIKKFTLKINRAMDLLALLDEDNEKIKEGSLDEQALLCSRTIRPHIADAALIAEKIEERVDQEVWTMPRVSDILFR